MDDKSFARNLRREMKEKWLKFSDSYLRGSGNEFLGRFYDFIVEGYKDSEQADYVFHEPAWATKQQVLLKDMLDFEAFRLPSWRAKGCALIGRTDFCKLEFVRNYFTACGLSEFAGDEAAGRYAVADCAGIKGYNGLIKSLVKNQDASYVIFNNCDSLLGHDEVLQAFKHLSEECAGLTVITQNGEAVNFKTDASFVFLGEENTLRLAVEKQVLKGQGLEASAYNHFDAFLHRVHVYDFDKGERYFGHDVSPVYS
jgi:hypothetical protein